MSTHTITRHVFAFDRRMGRLLGVSTDTFLGAFPGYKFSYVMLEALMVGEQQDGVQDYYDEDYNRVQGFQVTIIVFH